MHTAICAFDTHEQARRATDALVAAGFPRHDVHIEHKHSTSEGRAPNDQWDGLEREVAVDRSVLSSFGHFFASLFGADNGHAETYASHVERGGHVVVVDAHDEAQAQRASNLLRSMEAGHVNVVPRSEHRPLRDIVGERQARETPISDTYEAASSIGASSPLERERAVASNAVRPTTGPDLRDPDLERAPGLRYSDKDKPL